MYLKIVLTGSKHSERITRVPIPKNDIYMKNGHDIKKMLNITATEHLCHK